MNPIILQDDETNKVVNTNNDKNTDVYLTRCDYLFLKFHYYVFCDCDDIKIFKFFVFFTSLLLASYIAILTVMYPHKQYKSEYCDAKLLWKLSIVLILCVHLLYVTITYSVTLLTKIKNIYFLLQNIICFIGIALFILVENEIKKCRHDDMTKKEKNMYDIYYLIGFLSFCGIFMYYFVICFFYGEDICDYFSNKIKAYNNYISKIKTKKYNTRNINSSVFHEIKGNDVL